MNSARGIDRQRMRRNFAAHSDRYDTYAAVQKRVVGHLDQALEGHPLPAGPILDIGTGTGALASVLQERFPAGPLLLMDIAHTMTRAAAARLPSALSCDGDAGSLPLGSESCAGVFSSSVYQWVDDLAVAFAEVARVLRPGGLFGVALFGERTLYELRSAHREAVRICRSPRGSHVQSFPGRDEVAAALTAAGLVTDGPFTRMETELHPDVPTLLRQLKQIGASNAARNRPQGLASRRVMQAMMHCYEERFATAGGLPASYEVILAVARKATGPTPRRAVGRSSGRLET